RTPPPPLPRLISPPPPSTTLFRSGPPRSAGVLRGRPRTRRRPLRTLPAPGRQRPPRQHHGRLHLDLRVDGGRDVRVRRRHLPPRSEEHTSELQSRFDLVCRLLLEK